MQQAGLTAWEYPCRRPATARVSAARTVWPIEAADGTCYSSRWCPPAPVKHNSGPRYVLPLASPTLTGNEVLILAWNLADEIAEYV